MLDILFALALSCIAILPFIRMLWKSELESCRYSIFAVRDHLVLLVASGKLDDDSLLFRYYYKRTNDILRLTEKMHFEGLYQAILSTKLSKQRIADHKERMVSIQKIIHDSDPQVKDAIEAYYDAVIDLMMVNTNIFSFVYVVSNHRLKESLRQKLMAWAEKKDPKSAKIFHSVESDKHLLGIA